MTRLKTRQELIQGQRRTRMNLRAALKDAEIYAEILACLAAQIVLTRPAPRQRKVGK